MTSKRPKVIIIGGGFGGLSVANGLADQPVDVLLIDRNNFHTFTPLLYQVATSGLDPSEIAYPIRSIYRDKSNIEFLMGEVQSVELDAKRIQVKAHGKHQAYDYDYLVIAAGSVTNFFDNESYQQYGFGLKDLRDSLRLRNHILKLFEQASWMQDTEEREALMTMVIVGGGPTGLETAGALYELYNNVLAAEYKGDGQLRTRVILVEALDSLLQPYSENLQRAAKRQLESLGVEVVLGQMVEHVEPGAVKLKSGDVIRSYTMVWATGVKGVPLAETVGVELEKGHRIPVTRTLKIKGYHGAYAIGDIAHLLDPETDQPYPQVIPVAQQQGSLLAENILREMRGEAPKHFEYFDKGLMATIGRRRAVAWPFYKVELTGFLAWITWLALHLLWLMGFRNRLNVLINWVWNYLTYDRSVRIILDRNLESETDFERPLESAPRTGD
jgi:NADH:ubiquinone reductase (H+-translocating)